MNCSQGRTRRHFAVSYSVLGSSDSLSAASQQERAMDKVIAEAVKQALKFFQTLGTPRDLARGAEEVLKAAGKVVKG